MKTLLSLGLVLGLAACASLPTPAPTPASYDLGPLPAARLEAPGLALRSLEVQGAPWLNATSMQYRLLYADPARRQSYLESRWAAPPARLLELELRRALRVGATPAGQGCRLRLDVDEFIQVFDGPAQARGVIEARASLLDGRSERLLASQPFSLSQPAPEARAAGGVTALATASLQLEQDLARWLAAQASLCP
ncbi:ABC-type transport auxiliary lipoprotein family protein [Zoogloea sp.]|uniref:ABC-type transport auxiliary lipoprotein family protein n=1 Tax=Zoogloea sp. TaxID=49181 RepID=UPI0035B26449